MRVTELRTRSLTVGLRDLASRMALPHTGGLQQVERRELPYWQQAGWRHQGNQLSGYYRTRFGSFPGRIEMQGSRVTFHIQHAPSVVTRGSHGACFTPTGDGWYSVHMSRKPGDVSSGILTIERIISAAFQR